MTLDVALADYGNHSHAVAIINILDSYARDVMGGSQALNEHVRQNLIAALAQRPNAFSVLAFIDGQAVGLANCFEGFSTFSCQPLINIHDLAVFPAYRGRGIAQAILAFVEKTARARGCCKITLEVLQGNAAAQHLYQKLGYAGYQLDAEQGNALFWQKRLA